MSDYRWNRSRESIYFWDPCSEAEIRNSPRSDKDVLLYPKSVRAEDGLMALMRVVAELVELEETRGGKTPEELLEIKRKVGM